MTKTNGAPKRKRGRPRLELDPKKIEKLGAMNCSYDEIATILECSVSTLQRNYDQAIKKVLKNQSVRMHLSPEVKAALEEKFKQD